MAGPNPGLSHSGYNPPVKHHIESSDRWHVPSNPTVKKVVKDLGRSSSHQLGAAAKFSAYPCCIHDGCVCVQDVQDPPQSTPGLRAKSDGTGHINHPKRPKVSTKVSMSRISLRNLRRLIVQKSLGSAPRPQSLNPSYPYNVLGPNFTVKKWLPTPSRSFLVDKQ